MRRASDYLQEDQCDRQTEETMLLRILPRLFPKLSVPGCFGRHFVTKTSAALAHYERDAGSPFLF